MGGRGVRKAPQGVKIARHAPNFTRARAIWANRSFTAMRKAPRAAGKARGARLPGYVYAIICRVV